MVAEEADGGNVNRAGILWGYSNNNLINLCPLARGWKVSFGFPHSRCAEKQKVEGEATRGESERDKTRERQTKMGRGREETRKRHRQRERDRETEIE